MIILMNNNLQTLEFILKNYKNFNARATRDALVLYWKHLEKGGKMFWAMAGAMSSAQLGITLAPAIRNGLIHGMSVTGANLEESLFRLVAHDSYKDFPDYRYFTKEDDTKILENRMRRVTDTSIPEDEAFRAVEGLIVPVWEKATKENTRKFWHEYFYDLIQAIDKSKHEGKAEECWLLAAAENNLPIVVPGYEDSTFGNIFASHVKHGDASANIAKSGIEYMANFYDQYQKLSEGAGIGFFQIGGGISGDFPICVVPSLKYDMELPAKPWAYFRLDHFLRLILRRHPKRKNHLGQTYQGHPDVRHRVRRDYRRSAYSLRTSGMQSTSGRSKRINCEIYNQLI